MRPAIPLVVFIGTLVAVSVVLAAAASSFAPARAQVQHLDADLASLIRADYSADAEGTRLAPLDERIIEAVRQDEDRLRGGSSDVEIVPVFRVNPPENVGAGTGPGTTVSTPGGTPIPGETPAPAPGVTPPPGATPTPPAETPPTTSPGPGPGATPTSPPTPPGALKFYLHNNPSPPTGDAASQPVLPIDLATPTATTLYNYDTDRDTFPGLLIAKGGLGAGETDLTKYQAWRSPVLASDLTIQGNVVVHLWSAIKDFQQGKQGTATVYLRDFDGSSYTEIAKRKLNDPNWQRGSSTWVLKAFVIGVGSHTLPAGHSLELKVIVEPTSADDLWFAYDTAAYPSRVMLTN